VKRLLAIALLTGAPVASALADEPMAFDRPGIGFGTTVLAPGEVAWEQGLPDIERTDADGVRSTTHTFGSLLRIGLGASLELQLAGTPHVRMRTSDAQGHARVQGAGDSGVGLKWALPSSGTLEWALLAQYGLATGSAGLRPERHARSLGATVAGVTSQGRAYAVFAGHAHDDDGSGWQVSPSLSVFESDTLGAYIEAAIGSGAAKGAVAGGGLTWQPRPLLQFDVSLLRGLDDDAADWSGGVGIAVGFR